MNAPSNADACSRLPVTVLSGFLGAGKTTLLQHLLTQPHGLRIALIVNDMSEINVDAQLLRSAPELHRSQETLIELTNGCICCTLREDLLREIAALARQNRFDYLIVESSGISEPLPVAMTFDLQHEPGASLSEVSRLDTLVTVVDALNFPRDLGSPHTLQDRPLNADPGDERNISTLLIDQVEFADVIVLNKTDLALAEDLAEIEALLRKLNPAAKIVRAERGRIDPRTILNTRSFDLEKASQSAGWIKELQGVHTPETEEYGISSFVYRARRPFHPLRLYMLIDKGFPGVIRSKGFIWLASRHETMGIWAHAGASLSLEPGATWWVNAPESARQENVQVAQYLDSLCQEPWGDRRQELVLIGSRMNKDALTAMFNECLLTDSELAAGPAIWASYEDPFPAWTVIPVASIEN